MRIFDILAEARIREWEERGKTGVPGGVEETWRPPESHEKQLLGQIVAMIEEADQAVSRRGGGSWTRPRNGRSS